LPAELYRWLHTCAEGTSSNTYLKRHHADGELQLVKQNPLIREPGTRGIHFDALLNGIAIVWNAMHSCDVNFEATDAIAFTSSPNQSGHGALKMFLIHLEMFLTRGQGAPSAGVARARSGSSPMYTEQRYAH
jgi:hypothetical protein